jgi:hypothetical protein
MDLQPVKDSFQCKIVQLQMAIPNSAGTCGHILPLAHVSFGLVILDILVGKWKGGAA